MLSRRTSPSAASAPLPTRSSPRREQRCGTLQNWSSFGFATGASAPSLRGLNDAYTLTLFNGMRTAPYPLGDDGYRNFVDINTIPASIVDRIDVLQDGASATYGADAIAGVVNVIVKQESPASTSTPRAHFAARR